MIKAIIFDCFGVLNLDAHQSVAQKHPESSVEIIDLGRQSDYGWISKEQYLESLARITGESPHTVETFIETEHHLNYDLVASIKLLKAKYKIGLLSNVGRGWLEDFFSEHSLHSLFDVTVASGDVGMVKPSAEIFELMAKRINCQPSECIMIDDLADNCAGADAAGMGSIQFHSNKQVLRDLAALLDE